ncbi:MAG: hypothetical protein M0C28_36620 [Candidatus Moduliflexus flocculans]|nr:hypothetical protein [Candidatus Moduliflexus flocculans]
MSMAFSMVDATFNNFLNEKFALSGFQRSFLEFPRELPGFLVVFVSAALWFLCSRRLGVVAMIFGAVGAALIGFASSSYGVMVIWLFIYSLGQSSLHANCLHHRHGTGAGRAGWAAAGATSTPSATLPIIMGSFVVVAGIQISRISPFSIPSAISAATAGCCRRPAFLDDP